MAIEAETLGLLGYQMAFAVLDELERLNPGTGERVLESVRKTLQEGATANPHGNNAKMVEALVAHKY